MANVRDNKDTTHLSREKVVKPRRSFVDAQNSATNGNISYDKVRHPASAPASPEAPASTSTRHTNAANVYPVVTDKRLLDLQDFLVEKMFRLGHTDPVSSRAPSLLYIASFGLLARICVLMILLVYAGMFDAMPTTGMDVILWCLWGIVPLGIYLRLLRENSVRKVTSILLALICIGVACLGLIVIRRAFFLQIAVILAMLVELGLLWRTRRRVTDLEE